MTKPRKIATILGIQAAMFFGLMILMLFWTGLDWYWIFLASLAYMSFGLFLSCLTLWHVNRVNKRAFEQKMKAGMENEVVQTKTVEIDLPQREAFDLCLDALKTLDNIPFPLPDVKGLGLARALNRMAHAKLKLKLKEAERESGKIHARLRGKSFGFLSDPWDTFIITIRLESIDANTSRVFIESRPRVPTVVFDFGLDLHFVNQTALYLRQESNTRLMDEGEEVGESDEIRSQKLKVES